MDVKERLLQLGLIVKKLREEKALSQTELAYKIGKDQPSINRLEKGNVNPSVNFNGISIKRDFLVKFFIRDIEDMELQRVNSICVPSFQFR